MHDHISERPNKYAVVIILALSIFGIFYYFSKPVGEDIVSGIIKEVLSEGETVPGIGNIGQTIKEQRLSVEITTGDEKREVDVLNDFIPVEVGDRVFMRGSLFEDGEFSVVDVSRTKELILLSVFFVVLVLLTGGFKGFYSLVGLLWSFVVIFVFMVPRILNSAEPVSISVIGAIVILIPTLYLSYGFNKKSVAAFLGIILALIFVGLLANFVVGIVRFSGLSEASMYLGMETANPINITGLLIAGIIIAAIGVLDDVAAVQSSVVFGLASTDEDLRGIKLFKKAMVVGRDHSSAVVNTLVLAYTGAALPLILLLSLRGIPVSYFVSMEIVAEEIVRTLVSSSGLMLAIPLTTAFATLMVKRSRRFIR